MIPKIIVIYFILQLFVAWMICLHFNEPLI